MFSHEQIWTGIDRLAGRYGLSASGLARRAGLDPTTFIRSKRFTRAGRPRWPSTESIAKILAATGETLVAFAFMVTAPEDGASGAGGDGDQPENRPDSASAISARVSSTP